MPCCKKSEKKESSSPVRLKKSIGIIQGVGIIVGVMVGSGIFVSPVGVLKYTTSTGLSLLIWLLAGIFSLIGAIVYAELGVTIPKSGGEYIYIREAFGGVLSFMCLWINFFVVGAASVTVNARVFAEYVLLPLFPDCPIPVNALRLLSLWGILTLCLVNCYSVKWATKVAVLFSVCKVGALVMVIIIGLYYIARGNVESFQNSFEGSNLHPGGMALAFYQGFWAYAGWNYLNFLTNEMKNPARNLPIAIVISMFLITSIYLLANVAYLAVLLPSEMVSLGESSAAVAVVFAEKTMGVMSWIMPVCVGASVFGSMNGEILSMSRLTFSGAQEGHMPSAFATVSMKQLTPMPSIMLLSLVACVFVFIEDVFYLIELVGFAFNVIAGMAVCSLLYFRYKKYPTSKKPLKLHISAPIIFLILDVFIGALTVYQQPFEALLSICIMLTGIPIYIIGDVWKKKPKAFANKITSFTLFIQKMLLVLPEETDSQIGSVSNLEKHDGNGSVVEAKS